MEICKKVKFRSEQDALFHIAKRRETSKKSVSIRTYFCPHCNCWHLTSQLPRVEMLLEKTKIKSAEIILRLEKEIERLKQKDKNKTGLITQLNRKIRDLRNKE